MATATEFPHFFEKDGVKKRNVLRVEYEDARMEGSFPHDGSITIRIQDEGAQKAFKMTPQETLVLGEELTSVAKDQLQKKRSLWAQKAAQYQK